MRWIAITITMTANACMAPGALHPGMHPSVHGNTHAAGVNVGLAYATSVESEISSSNGLQAPFGEGFARFSTGAGQLELRVTPGMGFLAFRFDVVAAEDATVGLALRPSVGFGYFQFGAEDKTSQLSLAPNAAIIIWLAGGTAYLAPRIGYSHVEIGSGDISESTGFLVVGGNLGWVIDADPWSITLEIGIQRVASTEDNRVGGATLIVAPTVGIQL